MLSVGAVVAGPKVFSSFLLGLHVLDEVDDPVGVAHLVVVPESESLNLFGE